MGDFDHKTIILNGSGWMGQGPAANTSVGANTLVWYWRAVMHTTSLQQQMAWWKLEQAMLGDRVDVCKAEDDCI